MCRTIALFASLSILLLVDGVSIKDLRAPKVVKKGDELILDCDFSYNGDEVEELVIKWFYNGSPAPFYQWVPSLATGPQIIDSYFYDLIDLGYTIDGDEYTKHRALRFPTVTLKVAGDYKCQVSSFTSETFEERAVNVFVPPSSMTLRTIESDDTVDIFCRVDGVFPTPSLSLSWTQQGQSQHLPSNKTVISSQESSSLNSGWVSTSVSRDLVSMEDVAVCVLTLDSLDLPWTRTEETEMLEQEIPKKFLQIFGEMPTPTVEAVDAADYESVEIGDAAMDYELVAHEVPAALERAAPLEQTIVYNRVGSIRSPEALLLLLLLCLLLLNGV